VKPRNPDALPEHLVGRPDFGTPDYYAWWARRRAWARERGESVAVLIGQERALRAADKEQS